jgi:hypothetical protein
MGREAWTLRRCLELLDRWWPWILRVSSGTSFKCFTLSFSISTLDLILLLKSTLKLSEDLGAAPVWVFNNGNYIRCFISLITASFFNLESSPSNVRNQPPWWSWYSCYCPFCQSKSWSLNSQVHHKYFLVRWSILKQRLVLVLYFLVNIIHKYKWYYAQRAFFIAHNSNKLTKRFLLHFQA